jgi:membrane protease YdiL (CAAX protease family)
MENKPEKQQPQGPTVTCRMCKSVESADQTYCSNCGEPLKGMMKSGGTHSYSRMPESMVDDKHRKRIKEARVAILVVAVIAILYSIYSWGVLDGQIKSLKSAARSAAGRQIITLFHVEIAALFIMGVIFIGLYIWAKNNPFGASLTALFIYISKNIMSVGLDPSSLAKGVLLKIVMIAALANGVRAGLVYYRHTQGAAKQSNEQWKIIRSIIIFYSLYLASTLPLYWNVNKKMVLIVGCIDALLIIFYWMISKVTIIPLFRFNLMVFIYIFVGVGTLVLLLPLNLTYHNLLIKIFGIIKTKVSNPYITMGYDFGMLVFILCVMPAIWEEIAFRGLIQTGLSKQFTRWEVILITSATFAIIHNAFFSWPYLFLLGIVLAILRIKSESLWPPMVAHFVHNFAIIYIAYYNVPLPFIPFS